MKKIFFAISIFCVLLSFSTPFLVKAANTPIVQCDGVKIKCDEAQFRATLQRILSFIVWDIATPLGILALVIGGILILISAGNPGLSGLGRKMVIAAIVGLLLVYCTDIIINFVLKAIGSSDTVTL